MVLISGLANAGLDEMWAQVVEHRRRFDASGEGAKNAATSRSNGCGPCCRSGFFRACAPIPPVRAMLPELEGQVAEGALSPTLAVEKIAAVLGL